jgi:hypothetical protein
MCSAVKVGVTFSFSGFLVPCFNSFRSADLRDQIAHLAHFHKAISSMTIQTVKYPYICDRPTLNIEGLQDYLSLQRLRYQRAAAEFPGRLSRTTIFLHDPDTSKHGKDFGGC